MYDNKNAVLTTLAPQTLSPIVIITAGTRIIYTKKSATPYLILTKDIIKIKIIHPETISCSRSIKDLKPS
jgi:hypothetical protein